MANRPVLVVKDQGRQEHVRYHRAIASRHQFEDRFQALARRTFDATFACRIATDGVELSEALAGAIRPLIGFSPQDLEAPEGWGLFIHPDDHAVVATHIQRVLCGQRDLCVFRVFTPAGVVRWFGALTRPVWDALDRRVTHVYGLVQDYSACIETPFPGAEADAAQHAVPHLAQPGTF